VSLGTQLRRYWVPLAAILAIMATALVVGGYIVEHQRLRFPWEDVYRVSARFTSAQAVTPGQGQNVAVAGVTVGEIVRVELEDGQAVVTMDIERNKLGAVHRDARMLLRPKTGLNDMSVELDPGRRAAGRLEEDDTLPAAQTRPNVNPDEVLAALDADTRAYLSILLDAGGRGLAGRGRDLRAVLRASQPALEHTRRVTGALAARRRELRRLVGNLRVLSQTAAGRSRQLGELVVSGDRVFSTLAAEEDALRSSFAQLPGTLREAHRALSSTERFARRLGPTLQALRPAARALAPALRRVEPLAREAEPILRTQIRPLVRDARPLARDLTPALTDLDAVTPDLSSAFRVLNYVVNELAHNPPGREEGYLYWLAWFTHNANSILSIEDAHGVAWRGQLITSCSTAAALPPELLAVLGLPACP